MPRHPKTKAEKPAKDQTAKAPKKEKAAASAPPPVDMSLLDAFNTYRDAVTELKKKIGSNFPCVHKPISDAEGKLAGIKIVFMTHAQPDTATLPPTVENAAKVEIEVRYESGVEPAKKLQFNKPDRKGPARAAKA